MTADTDQLSRPDRRRLLGRLDELDVIDREMRRPGTFAATCEPPPLHRAGRGTKNCSTESTKNCSTNPVAESTTGLVTTERASP
jgi:hypothetical protein